MRLHRRRTWTVQSYSPGCVNLRHCDSNLIHTSLDLLESTSQTASWCSHFCTVHGTASLYFTSSSAAAERLREPLSQLKSCQLLHNCTNTSSAVAEMGDRGHNRHGPKRGGGAVPLSRSAGNPSNTMWPAPRSTSVPSGVFIYPAVWPQ